MKILLGTPWWVFAIFFYLLLMGLKSMHKRTMSLYDMPIVPIALLIWNLSKYAKAPFPIWWLPVFVVSASLGFLFFYQNVIAIDKESRTITVEGTKLILIMLMSLFAVRYFFGYMKATQMAFIAPYIWIESAFLTLISGVFWGRMIKNYVRYFS